MEMPAHRACFAKPGMGAKVQRDPESGRASAVMRFEQSREGFRGEQVQPPEGHVSSRTLIQYTGAFSHCEVDARGRGYLIAPPPPNAPANQRPMPLFRPRFEEGAARAHYGTRRHSICAAVKLLDQLNYRSPCLLYRLVALSQTCIAVTWTTATSTFVMSAPGACISDMHLVPPMHKARR